MGRCTLNKGDQSKGHRAYTKKKKVLEKREIILFQRDEDHNLDF